MYLRSLGPICASLRGLKQGKGTCQCLLCQRINTLCTYIYTCLFYVAYTASCTSLYASWQQASNELRQKIGRLSWINAHQGPPGETGHSGSRLMYHPIMYPKARQSHGAMIPSTVLGSFYPSSLLVYRSTYLASATSPSTRLASPTRGKTEYMSSET